MPYKYVLTPSMLDSSLNEMVIDFKRLGDGEFAWKADSRTPNAWSSLIADMKRNLKINHAPLESEVKELLANLESKQEEKKNLNGFK